MKKKRKIDFILHNNGFEKLTFRFYPRSSSCHSFNDEPPKSWDDVYKVYYQYSIIRHCAYGNSTNSEIVFDSYCDECSVIGQVALACKLISEGESQIVSENDGNKYVTNLYDEIFPIGYGVSWKREKKRNDYEISLFNCKNVGFRFFLIADELRDFAEYLNMCCEYMLAHGDPI